MRIQSSYDVGATPRPTAPAPVAPARPVAPPAGTFSVLNDFRYLTDSDKDLLRDVTGEVVEPGLIDRAGAASAFAQQLALDRRTGELAPNQHVTGVYLRNAAAELEKFGEQRPGFTNPYSGEVFDAALAWLDARGRARADIRL
ncbi:hypothetical protein [Gephyromycinifex aptenodytis]|uniref:hypothetical protein n=1 Tax=Gephyromycinifex aptenodytis TaxID=2716227 RepID=UPI0014473AAE|nr:hypothetical protein [Gephyromycinifex aptenodytis]